MSRPTRPERTLGQAALDLDADLEAGRRPAGRVERMVAAALDAAVREGVVDQDLDAGTAALAVSLGRAVDLGARDPYAVAAAGRELAQVLARLRLDPESRDPAGRPASGGDEVEDWLRRVSEPR